MRPASLLAALIVLFGASLVRADAIPADRQPQALKDALNQFDSAVGKLRSSPESAAKELRQAAAGFQSLVDSGLRNQALEFNLGNTWFRLGDVGRSILHYRRAERLSPRDPSVAANLAHARGRVEPAITPGGSEQLIGRLLFWHYTTSAGFRFLCAALGSLLGWGMFAAWLRWRGGPLLAVAGLFIVFGFANGTSVYYQIHEDANHPQAVILTGPQTLRTGRGEGYEPAIKQTLGPGIEVRILNERADWVEVELRDGHAGWLPLTAIEKV